MLRKTYLILIAAAAMITLSAAAAPVAGATVKHTVTRDSKSFIIDGKRVFIYSGALHYFRVPEKLWADRLAKMKAAGLNTVETYVAWNKIEPREGHADYSELDRFITLAEKMGLYVIVRPGPYICAEWEAGGYPVWAIMKGGRLRTPDPQQLEVSTYYYNHVLPVVKKHLYTKGGRVIMVQIENEYSFQNGATDAEMTEYVRHLYKLTQKNGIDTPIITCWTRVARKEQDPDMAKIMDSCNFYPRGDWKSVENALKELREQQPGEPLMVTELEGGWFAQVGGMLSIEQKGVDGPEINALTKLVMALGVTSANYYMFHGGTNFGQWPAKNLTTTYDYYAPIGEAGWPHDKYFDVRLIGQFLGAFGPALAGATEANSAAKLVEGDPESVRVFTRKTDAGYFLFVQNRTEQPQIAKVQLTAGGKTVTVPGNGTLELAPRGFVILPALVSPAPAKAGYEIVSSSAEIIPHDIGKTRYITLYGTPDSNFEIKLRLPGKPAAKIPTRYTTNWDAASKVLTVSGSIDDANDMLFAVDANTKMLVVSSDRAARMNWSPAGPIVASGLVFAGVDEKHKSPEIFFRPGTNDVSFPPSLKIAGAKPSAVAGSLLVNAKFDTPDPKWEYPVEPKFKIKIDPLFEGDFKPLAALDPLEKMGLPDPGFYRYLTKFKNETDFLKLDVEPYINNSVEAVIDGGKYRLTNQKEKPLSTDKLIWGKVPAGEHTLMLVYQNPGRHNGGEEMGGPQGIKKVRAVGDSVKISKEWKLAAGLQGENLGWWKDTFKDADWQQASLPNISGTEGAAWYRAEFTVKDHPGWFAPLKLRIKADGYAFIYLNGELVGRFSDLGPQYDFYLPEPWLHYGGKNSLVIAVQARGTKPAALLEAAVEPYRQYMYQIKK